jgi:hypothetical protein
MVIFSIFCSAISYVQATGKLYHLRLRVECTLFVICKAGSEPMPYGNQVASLEWKQIIILCPYYDSYLIINHDGMFYTITKIWCSGFRHRWLNLKMVLDLVWFAGIIVSFVKFDDFPRYNTHTNAYCLSEGTFPDITHTHTRMLTVWVKGLSPIETTINTYTKVNWVKV